MAKKNRKKNTYKSRRQLIKLALLTVLAVLLVGAGACAVFLRDKTTVKPTLPTNGNPDQPTKPYVNLSPPTQQDQQDNQAHKQSLTEQSSPTPTGSDGKKVVPVIITSATAQTINGYVTGVFEDGGICTAKLTNSSTGQSSTFTSSGFQNASYTSCAPIHPNVSGSGWSVVLSYSSSTAEGTSASQKLQ
jgi:hypothetical protein